MKQVPTFRPSWEEFQNFSKFVESLYPKCQHVGLAKIIPPPGWKPIKQFHTQTPRLKLYDEQFDFDDIIIPSPIKQYVSGSKGCYQLKVEVRKPMSIRQLQKEALVEEAKLVSQLSKNLGNESLFDHVQTVFWKNIRFSAATYGSDTEGSLMDPGVAWNVNELNTILNLIGLKVPGVTASFIYVGMYKSMFAWHTEDMNLFSINFLHFGHPKRWYCIPAAYSKKFEEFCNRKFPQIRANCSEFLRHKTTMIDPKLLLQNGFPVYTCVQEEGEFIITMPYSYHAGFNHSFNLAESSNFAIEPWIPFGKIARPCTCSKNTLVIDMKLFEAVYSQLLRGEISLNNYVFDVSHVVIPRKDKRKINQKDNRKKSICDDEDCNPDFCSRHHPFPFQPVYEDFPALDALSHTIFVEPKRKKIKHQYSTIQTRENVNYLKLASNLEQLRKRQLQQELFLMGIIPTPSQFQTVRIKEEIVDFQNFNIPMNLRLDIQQFY